MDLTKRLVAPSAEITTESNAQLDLDAFVKRLLLFEHYILYSMALLELKGLLQAFGFDGLIAILESGAISIDCLPVHTAFLVDDPSPNKLRPPFHYSFGRIAVADPLDYVNKCFDKLMPSLNLHGRQSMHLRKAIYSVLASSEDDGDEASLNSTTRELIMDPQLLVHACSMASFRHIGRIIPPDTITLLPKQLAQHDFRIDTNLQSTHGLSQLNEHKVVESAIGAIAKRNDRIALMYLHNAMSGFKEDDIPIFEEKLAFLASALNPSINESRFQRIIEIRDLPEIPHGTITSISAKQLLKARNSLECALFRQWLASSDEMTDAEIAREGRSIAELIGSFIRSNTGRVIRFLVTSSLGLIPGAGQLASLSLSALDQFAIERIFPQSGPIAFIDSLYPSIFEEK
jgi:hypothetical protein